MATAVQNMQTARFLSNHDRQNAAEEEKGNAIAEQRSKIEEVRTNRITEVKEQVEAMDTNSFWTTLGTIVLGPVVGTLIGMGVGGLANNGSEDASREAHTAAGVANIERGKAEEDFDNAVDDLEDAKGAEEQLEKFAKELRQGAGETSII